MVRILKAVSLGSIINKTLPKDDKFDIAYTLQKHINDIPPECHLTIHIYYNLCDEYLYCMLSKSRIFRKSIEFVDKSPTLWFYKFVEQMVNYKYSAEEAVHYFLIEFEHKTIIINILKEIDNHPKYREVIFNVIIGFLRKEYWQMPNALSILVKTILFRPQLLQNCELVKEFIIPEWWDKQYTWETLINFVLPSSFSEVIIILLDNGAKPGNNTLALYLQQKRNKSVDTTTAVLKDQMQTDLFDFSVLKIITSYISHESKLNRYG